MEKALEIIKNIENEKTTFLGIIVNKYNYSYEVRARLVEMGERREISPKTLWSALKITAAKMTENEKEIELNCYDK